MAKAIATFIMPYPDFDYAGWAVQLGLAVVKSERRNDGLLLFIIEGERDDIRRFENELDFEAERITPPVSGEPGPALLVKLFNTSFGRS